MNGVAPEQAPVFSSSPVTAEPTKVPVQPVAGVSLSKSEKAKIWYAQNRERILAERRAEYLANTAKYKAKAKERYHANRDENIRKRKAHYLANREREILKRKAWWAKNRETRNAIKRASAYKRYHHLRGQVLDKYGNKCSQCPEDRADCLQLGHVNNDGHVERRQLRLTSFRIFLNALEDTSGRYCLQCANCNWIQEITRRRKSRPISEAA